MTLGGLHYLAKLAKTAPENGIICEVGPLYGSSTWVLCQNSHPSVQVYSIDTWDASQAWIKKRLPDALPFSLDSFRTYTQDCLNLQCIQGMSPDCVKGLWNHTINLFFDDATHGDPGFSENLNFFRTYLSDDAIICGDDYASGWPDIIRTVNKTAAELNSTVDVMGRVWALAYQSRNQRNKKKSVADLIEKWGDVEVEVEVFTLSGQTFRASPNMWAGSIFGEDPVVGIQIHNPSTDRLKLGAEVLLLDGSIHSIFDNYAARFSSPIVNIRLRPEGPAALHHSVRYQVSQIYQSKKGILKTINSKSSSRNFVDKEFSTDLGLSAIRLEIMAR